MSHVAVPLTVGRKFVGLIGMGAYGQKRSWPTRLILRLRLVGEVFANAILRKRLTEEMENLRSELVHVTRISAMGEVVASVSHELNQPLAAILSNSQAAQRFLASDDPDLDVVREIVSDIVADDRRAGSVIRNIRKFLQKGERELTELDVNEATIEVLNFMSYQLNKNEITVVREFEENLPAVLGDSIQLQQVIMNLLLNSIEAVENLDPGSRRITVRSSLDEDGFINVAVDDSVDDSGTGFDSESIEHLFDPFFTTKPRGMGIGLSISKSIIESHGGRLSVTSEEGEGATISFTLPVHRGVTNE
jgi:C4-dicarboxylate-specific signal transduction histidine kinase